MKICDIRHWQGDIDWNKASKELSLAIFRATKNKEEDPRYIDYTTNCGIPYAAYCYLHASNAEEAREEARVFVKIANKAVKRPLFYLGDIEHENQNENNTEEICYAFLDELKILRCERVGLYINTRFPYCGRALNLCDIIWMPHWGDNDGEIPPDNRAPEYYCDLWQYTSKGHVDGIKTNADLNVIYGNKSLEWFLQDVHSTLGERLLKNGRKGNDVKELQQLLNKLLNRQLIEDGEYGPATKKVVEEFQVSHHLDNDGIYGPITHQTLLKANEDYEREKNKEFPSYIVTKNKTPIYSGNAKKFNILRTLNKKFRICPIFDEQNNPIINNNYMAINLGNQIGWIHTQYLTQIK